MIELINKNKTMIIELCRKYRVQRLDIFGSAVDGSFDEKRSDLDFLAEFQPMEPRDYADSFFGFLFDLEALFQRRVDLLTPKAIRNPYLNREIEQTRQNLYAA